MHKTISHLHTAVVLAVICMIILLFSFNELALRTLYSYQQISFSYKKVNKQDHSTSLKQAVMHIVNIKSQRNNCEVMYPYACILSTVEILK